MGAYFAIGRATLHSTYVPRVGEVCRHEQPDGIPDRLVVGDGKTSAQDLPSLQPLDLYARVDRLEEEVQMLRERNKTAAEKTTGSGSVTLAQTGPDPDSRVWETQRTPQPHATPPQGSVRSEGSVPRSGTENEPVAWAVMERDGFGIECTFIDRLDACDWCDGRQEIVPLYRHHPEPCPYVTGKTTRYCTLTPFTLTDAERRALELAIESESTPDVHFLTPAAPSVRDTLRGLLERLT